MEACLKLKERLTLLCEEDPSFTRTNWNPTDKHDLNQPNAVHLIPITCPSLCNRMLCLMISNAASRSNRTSTDTSPLSETKK